MDTFLLQYNSKSSKYFARLHSKIEYAIISFRLSVSRSISAECRRFSRPKELIILEKSLHLDFRSSFEDQRIQLVDSRLGYWKCVIAASILDSLYSSNCL